MNLLSRFKNLTSQKKHNYTTFLKDYPVLFHSKVMSNKPKALGKLVVNYSKPMIEKYFMEYMDEHVINNPSLLLKQDDVSLPKIYFYTQKNYIDDITYSYISVLSGKSFSDIKGNNLQEEIELNINEKIMLNQLQLIGVDSKSLKTEDIKRDGLIIVDNIDLLAHSTKELESHLRSSNFPVLIGSLENGDIALIQDKNEYKLLYKKDSVSVSINESNKLAVYCYDKFKKEAKRLINALPLGFNDKGEIDNIHVYDDKGFHLYIEGPLGSGKSYYATQLLLNKNFSYFDQMFKYRKDFKESLNSILKKSKNEYEYILIENFNSCNILEDVELAEIIKRIIKDPKLILITTNPSKIKNEFWESIGEPSVKLNLNNKRRLIYKEREYYIPFNKEAYNKVYEL